MRRRRFILCSPLHLQWSLTLYLLAAVSSPVRPISSVRAIFKVESFEEVEQLQTEGLVSDEMTWQIIEMLNHPINPNRARIRELSQIPGLSESEAALIACAGQQLERPDSRSEVREIPALTVDQFDLLRAFTQISLSRSRPRLSPPAAK